MKIEIKDKGKTIECSNSLVAFLILAIPCGLFAIAMLGLMIYNIIQEMLGS